MKYRHEWKHEINHSDFLTLQMRLAAIMKRDPNAMDGSYKVRSLYFDTPTDRALREKLDGISHREKFRLRYYNDDTSHIVLEKKGKINGLCFKQGCPVSRQEAELLLNGDPGWMIRSDRPLCRELYFKMKTQLLRPKKLVDYTRIPFVYGPGNVRVTIDFNIKTGSPADFLQPDSLTIPVAGAPLLLEVKWDEYLPEIIRAAVALQGRHASAFSKYAQSRIYG